MGKNKKALINLKTGKYVKAVTIITPSMLDPLPIHYRLELIRAIANAKAEDSEWNKLDSGLKVEDPVTYAKYFAKKNSYFKSNK
jgi:hypothetical protein